MVDTKAIRRRRVIRVVILLAILALVIPRASVAQSAPWISQTAATEYANNFIASYNALVDANQALQANFSAIQHYFRLYHALGSNFEVFVTRTTSIGFASHVSDTVAFIFTPIQSSEPKVVIENNRTLESMLGMTIYNFSGSFHVSWIITPPLHSGEAFYDATINLENKVLYVPLVWTTSISHDILNNTSVNSKMAAQELYNFNVEEMQIGTAPPAPNPILAFLSNPWVVGFALAFGILVGVVYLYREFKPHPLHPPKKKAKGRK